MHCCHLLFLLPFQIDPPPLFSSSPPPEPETDPSLSLDQLDGLSSEFIRGIESGDFRSQGWPETMYGVSKLLEATYTRVLAGQLKGRAEGSK